jgi:hypothetical protein
MTPAELASAIWQRAASLKAAGRLTKENFVSEVSKMLAKPAVPSTRLPDEAWLAELKANPAYASFDIDAELSKCRAWCKERRRVATRRTLLAWLNNKDPALPPAEPAKPQIDTYKEPPLGWRLHLAKLAPEYTGQSWDTVRLAFGRRIWQAVLLEQSRKETL